MSDDSDKTLLDVASALSAQHDAEVAKLKAQSRRYALYGWICIVIGAVMVAVSAVQTLLRFVFCECR